MQNKTFNLLLSQMQHSKKQFPEISSLQQSLIIEYSIKI